VVAVKNELALPKSLQKPTLFCAVTWPHSKKAMHKACIKLAKYASVYSEVEVDGALHYAVGFKKTARDARLCFLFLEKVKELKNYTCFISGQPEKITWRLLNVIECYSKALKTKNRQAYCQVETETESLPYRGMRMNIETLKYEPIGEVGEQIVCMSPCRDLAPFLMLSKKSGIPLVDQVVSAAHEKKQILCPLFKPNLFKELLSESKRYW
jgi:hypothetical protein